MHSMILSAPRTERGWRQDPALAVLGRRVIKAAGKRFPAARPGDLSLSLILPGKAEARGFSHRGDRQGYPASLVKLFFMVFVQAEIEAGRLGNTREVRQALQAMIG